MQPQTNLSNAPAGPGAIEETTVAPKSVLDGASEYEYVTILNPLSVDFYAKVAITRPVNAPLEVRDDGSGGQMTLSESDIQRNYGLNLRNKDHVGRVNIINRVHIPAGKTINLLGNEAQVVCRQIVNEILQREGKKLMLADPHQRRLVEDRIVLSRRSVNDLMDGSGPMAVQEQLQGAVDGLNAKQEMITDEQEFPELTKPSEPTTRVTGNNTVGNQQPTRIFVGRPRGSKNRTTEPKRTVTSAKTTD